MEKSKKKSHPVIAPKGKYRFNRILSMEEVPKYRKLRRNLYRVSLVCWVAFMVLVWTNFPLGLASYVSALWVLLGVIIFSPVLKDHLPERVRIFLGPLIKPNVNAEFAEVEVEVHALAKLRESMRFDEMEKRVLAGHKLSSAERVDFLSVSRRIKELNRRIQALLRRGTQ